PSRGPGPGQSPLPGVCRADLAVLLPAHQAGVARPRVPRELGHVAQPLATQGGRAVFGHVRVGDDCMDLRGRSSRTRPDRHPVSHMRSAIVAYLTREGGAGPSAGVGHDASASASMTARTNWSGASWGRLWPTPPEIVRWA